MANFSPTKFGFGDTLAAKSEKKKDREAIRGEALTEAFGVKLLARRESTEEALEGFRELASKMMENPNVTDEQLEQAIFAPSRQIAESYALSLEQLGVMAEQSGVDRSMLASGTDFIDQQELLTRSVVDAGRSQQRVETLSPEDTEAIGFPKGAVVQRKPDQTLTLTFDPTVDQSTLDKRVELLMASGVDEAKAQGIAAGRFIVSVNPISGERVVIDVNDGSVVSNIPPPEGPGGDVPSMLPPDIDTAAATGAPGALANIANIVSDAVGAGVQFDGAQEATNALESIGLFTITTMQAEIPGRPSKFLLEKLEELTVKPNSLLQGEERAESRLTQTKRLLDGEIARIEVDVLPLELQPNVRVETQLNLTQLKRLSTAYEDLLKGFDQQEGGDPVIEALLDKHAPQKEK